VPMNSPSAANGTVPTTKMVAMIASCPADNSSRSLALVRT
jgi:hypothetical protein